VFQTLETFIIASIDWVKRQLSNETGACYGRRKLWCVGDLISGNMGLIEHENGAKGEHGNSLVATDWCPPLVKRYRGASFNDANWQSGSEKLWCAVIGGYLGHQRQPSASDIGRDDEIGDYPEEAVAEPEDRRIIGQQFHAQTGSHNQSQSPVQAIDPHLSSPQVRRSQVGDVGRGYRHGQHFTEGEDDDTAAKAGTVRAIALSAKPKPVST